MASRNHVKDMPTRLGLIVPADCLIDDEIWRLAAQGCIPLISRTRAPLFGPDVPLSAQGLVELAKSPDIEDAAHRLSIARPQAVAYVDTSITFIRGPGGDAEIAERIARLVSCPVTVTSAAVVDALRALGASRISILTPYPDEINDALPAFFASSGIEVLDLEKLRTNYGTGATSFDMAEVDPEEIIDAVKAVTRPNTEGIFISCTALRTLDVIEKVEKEMGKPIVTAMQATMWRVQRVAGVMDDVEGGGLLFEV